MKPIDPDGFERKFRETIDPWDYSGSAFEARKRRVLLRACGTGPYGRGLELGCAIGETSRELARICLRLVALDSSPTALREARRRNAGDARIAFAEAVLPADFPAGRFDLIVVSELVYYLKPRDLRRLMERVVAATAPGGRVVLLHHTVPFADAAQDPALAQREAHERLSRAMRCVFVQRTARYEVASFAMPKARAA